MRAARELLGGTVTLVFTDVEGSTELLSEIGAERYAPILDEHREIVNRAVAESGGREVDSRGEELFAVFARARDAVVAAVAVEQAHESAPWPEGATVRVRIGMHTGEPVVHDGGYLGVDVHRAARICAAGHGGQVLLSQTTCGLLVDTWPEGVTAQDLGEHELKGLGRPERIFQLLIPGLSTDFPPLRVTTAQPGRFAGDEGDLAKAVGAAALRSRPRHARRGLRLGRAQPRERYADLGWEARALISEAPEEARHPLAELGAELFNAARSTADADRFLADLDRKRLEHRLAEYREMAVVSTRAQEEAEILAERMRLIGAVDEKRKELDTLSEEISAALASGGPESSDSVPGAIEDLRGSLAELDTGLEQARAGIGLTGMKLHRTRHHGIFRHGSVFVVPTQDELGIEHFQEFATLPEAHEYRKTVNAQVLSEDRLGGGAPHDFGAAWQGYIRGDRT